MARRRGAAARDPRPPANPRPNRDPAKMARYREAQDIIKSAAPGSPEFEQARTRLERIGGEYGLNWQQHIPAPPPPPPPAPPPPPPPPVPEPAPPPPPVPENPYPAPESNPIFQPPPPVQPPPIEQAPPPMPQPAEPPIEQGPAYSELTSEQQVDRLQDVAGDVAQTMAVQAKQFNPNTFQQQYQAQFRDAMDRAYNAVYDQFNRRNEEVFKQQNEQFAQMAAERGLDPNSEAYKTMYKQLADRQDRARQEAQNAATQASYQVQQQGFQQASDTALMPGSIAQQFMQPALVGMEGFYDQRSLGQQQAFAGQQSAFDRQFQAGQGALDRQFQAAQGALDRQFQGSESALQRDFLGREGQLDRDAQFNLQGSQQDFARQQGETDFQYQMRLQRLAHRQRLAEIRATPRGGGGGGGGAPFAPFDAYMEQQILQGYGGQPAPNPVNSGIGGFAQGIGAGLTGALMR